MPHATSVRSVHLDAAGGGQGMYDQSLLATTPEVSRAAKQESYNVDLLEERPPTTHVLESASGPGGAMGLNGGMNKEISYTSLPTRASRPAAFREEGYHRPINRPWYRRPVGIVIIAIVSIVIVGAIVGGAVGGTVGHHKNHTEQQQQTEGPTSMPSGGQQGIGPSSQNTTQQVTGQAPK